LRLYIRARAEQEDHTAVWLAFGFRWEGVRGIHECVWEAHFCSVYDAIPYTFYQCKDVMVLWIENNLLEG